MPRFATELLKTFFRNLDLYDVEKTIKEVVRHMDGNPIISYPAECDFTLLNGFIREVTKVAFEMQGIGLTFLKKKLKDLKKIQKKI